MTEPWVSATILPLSGGVAQLVRALPCHGRGRGFESRRSRLLHLPLPRKEDHIMAKKKTTKTARSTRMNIAEMSDYSAPKSYVSLAYGIITVVVLFVIVFLGIRSIAQKNKGEISDDATNIETISNISESYVVQGGETLFSIAEKFYQNGELWPTIAAENKIQNPNALEKGTKLNIPKSETSAMETAEEKIDQVPVQEDKPVTQTVPVQDKITANTYTVVRGDNLWNIAVRAYGDGFKWTEIAKANNLANPSLIHSGNVFKLPR